MNTQMCSVFPRNWCVSGWKITTIARLPFAESIYQRTCQPQAQPMIGQTYCLREVLFPRYVLWVLPKAHCLWATQNDLHQLEAGKGAGRQAA